MPSAASAWPTSGSGARSRSPRRSSARLRRRACRACSRTGDEAWAPGEAPRDRQHPWGRSPMAVSDAHEYLHRLLTDEQFLGHVAAQPQDKRMAIARDAGLSFSDEELATAKREVLSMTVGQMLQEGMRHETARAALAAG